MPVNRKEKPSIDLKGAVKSAQVKVTTSLTQVGSIAKKSGNKPLTKRIEQEKKKLKSTWLKLVAEAIKLQKKFSQEARKTEAFKRKTERTVRLKATGDANNMLLEIKKRDLLQKAAEIEATYEGISKNHEELVRQKQDIANQTEKLRIANQEILEKNQELETKAESLLDQADYLHEANETITNMHLELAKQKDEILSKNEELESLNAEKNNLIGIVAHDLKSPLNQIKGLVSLIKMTSNLEGEPANCLSMIEASAVRLNSMIGKILDIEAIESKQLNLSIEPVDLTELFNSLAIRFKLDAIRKNIDLIETTPPHIQIDLDRNYLTQILENLLSNAIKFSPNYKKVFLNLYDHDDHIIGEVRDEGPGLSDDDKKKLFSKYQKLSAKPTGSESSTGLGLSIVKKFTESMGGQIWCESELGKGASFFVKFYKTPHS